MTIRRNARGMSLIEVLVAMSVFGIVSVLFLRVAMSGNDASQATQQVSGVSEEARLGLNRMLRDTREASRIANATPTSYTIFVDFNNDQIFTSPSPNSMGDYEVETFSYSAGRILLNGEVLIDGVSQVGSNPIFTYTSSLLDYDWDRDGVTTLDELNAADDPPHNITTLGNVELLLNSVNYRLKITNGPADADFFLEAQLRNAR